MELLAVYDYRQCGDGDDAAVQTTRVKDGAFTLVCTHCGQRGHISLYIGWDEFDSEAAYSTKLIIDCGWCTQVISAECADSIDVWENKGNGLMPHK